MPLSSREASILGNANGSRSSVQLSSSSFLPYHVCQPHSPGHGWIRNLCPLLSFLNAPNIKCLHNHNQYHPFFNSQHLDCPGNSCKCHLEHRDWSAFRERSSNQPDPGSIAGHQQKSKEAPSSSPATEPRHSHRWKKFQS